MTLIKIRRGLSADWVAINPILAQGEPGFEVDTNKLKIGDGIHPWNELDYLISSDISVDPVSGDVLLAHVNSDLPHPVYDDGPSLDLLYQNAKV